MHHALREGGLLVTDDPSRLDLRAAHRWLSTSYWALGIPFEVVQRAARHSLCMGVYDLSGAGEPQIGFGRAITDRATYAYLSDIIVDPAHRGRGVGKLIMRAFTSHPDLQGLRRWMLLTRDAHTLYEPFGFAAMAHPERAMERWNPDVYKPLA